MVVDTPEEVVSACGEAYTKGTKVGQTESGCVVGVTKAGGSKV